MIDISVYFNGNYGADWFVTRNYRFLQGAWANHAVFKNLKKTVFTCGSNFVLKYGSANGKPLGIACSTCS